MPLQRPAPCQRSFSCKYSSRDVNGWYKTDLAFPPFAHFFFLLLFFPSRPPLVAILWLVSSASSSASSSSSSLAWSLGRFDASSLTLDVLRRLEIGGRGGERMTPLRVVVALERVVGIWMGTEMGLRDGG